MVQAAEEYSLCSKARLFYKPDELVLWLHAVEKITAVSAVYSRYSTDPKTLPCGITELRSNDPVGPISVLGKEKGRKVFPSFYRRVVCQIY